MLLGMLRGVDSYELGMPIGMLGESRQLNGLKDRQAGWNAESIACLDPTKDRVQMVVLAVSDFHVAFCDERDDIEQSPRGSPLRGCGRRVRAVAKTLVSHACGRQTGVGAGVHDHLQRSHGSFFGVGGERRRPTKWDWPELCGWVPTMVQWTDGSLAKRYSTFERGIGRTQQNP